MKNKKSAALLKRLIDNRISRDELDLLLEGMDDEETVKIYEEHLQEHFNKIMEDHRIKEEAKKKSFE